MRLKVVLDSDGLIKLAKAGVLDRVVSAWECFVPRAVYAETVERGARSGYPDAFIIRQALLPSHVRPHVRNPQAAALLQRKRGLGRGERDALHLFCAAGADAIITDDLSFTTFLEHANLDCLPPALVLVQLANEGQLSSKRALEALERMRPFIRSAVYRAAMNDLSSPSPFEEKETGDR